MRASTQTEAGRGEGGSVTNARSPHKSRRLSPQGAHEGQAALPGTKATMRHNEGSRCPGLRALRPRPQSRAQCRAHRYERHSHTGESTKGHRGDEGTLSHQDRERSGTVHLEQGQGDLIHGYKHLMEGTKARETDSSPRCPETGQDAMASRVLIAG